MPWHNSFQRIEVSQNNQAGNMDWTGRAVINTASKLKKKKKIKICHVKAARLLATQKGLRHWKGEHAREIRPWPWGTTEPAESEEVKAKADVALDRCNGTCSHNSLQEVALHWSLATLTPCAAPGVCHRASMNRKGWMRTVWMRGLKGMAWPPKCRYPLPMQCCRGRRIKVLPILA